MRIWVDENGTYLAFSSTMRRLWSQYFSSNILPHLNDLKHSLESVVTCRVQTSVFYTYLARLQQAPI